MATLPISASPFALTPPVMPIPPAAISRVLSRFDREQLAGFVAVAIDLMDLADPDADDEDNDDREASDGDDQDQAFVEWTSMRGAAKRGPNILAGEEDDEAAGDEQDGNFAEDEECAEFARSKRGAGCAISDPGGCEHDGREQDEGVASLPSPPLPVFALDPNIFTDKRVRLD